MVSYWCRPQLGLASHVVQEVLFITWEVCAWVVPNPLTSGHVFIWLLDMFTFKVDFVDTSPSFLGRSWATSLGFAPNLTFPPSSFSPCFDCPDPSTGFVFSSSFMPDFDFAQELTTCPGLEPEFEPPNLLVGREMSCETLSLLSLWMNWKSLNIIFYTPSICWSAPVLLICSLSLSSFHFIMIMMQW